MNTISVPVAVPFDSTVAGDIAITAAEGGIGYWAVIDSYEWERWSQPDDSLGNIIVADDFVFFTIGSVFVDGEEPFVAVDITPSLIERGIRLFLAGAPSFERRNFADITDLGAMDADEADAVIQLGVFGELVYG